jgi:hypothetical protein
VSVPAGPVIVGAVMTAGHDGRAEAVLAVRYPNGATRSVTVTEEAAADAVRAAGVDRLDDLRGHPWTVLLPMATTSATDHHPNRNHDDHPHDHHADEEPPCST